MLKFDADVKKTTTRHQCKNRFAHSSTLGSLVPWIGFQYVTAAAEYQWVGGEDVTNSLGFIPWYSSE